MNLIPFIAVLLAPILSPVHSLPSPGRIHTKSTYPSWNADITQFYGLVFDEGISLHWITASERGNVRFRIERSHDGQTFRPLGYVDTEGHSLLPRHYSFTDAYPFPGNNYYRLSTENQAGQVSGSILLQLYSHNTYTPGIRVFPNPFQREILVQLPRQLAPDAQLVLLALHGDTLLQWPAPHGQRMTLINLPDLPNGAYVLLLLNGNQTYTARLLRTSLP